MMCAGCFGAGSACSEASRARSCCRSPVASGSVPLAVRLGGEQAPRETVSPGARQAGCFQPANSCRLLSTLTSIYFRFLVRRPLKDCLHTSFGGTIKGGSCWSFFHYLLRGFVSMPSFLPAPIWLTTEVAGRTTCGYQTASAGFAPQQQKHLSPVSSAGRLFLACHLCCFASLDFGLTKLHCAQA